MHELDADGAGIDAARGLGFVAGHIQLRMRQRLEVVERIEIGLKISPAAERIHHPFQLLAVNVHHYGGQGWKLLASPRSVQAGREPGANSLGHNGPILMILLFKIPYRPDGCNLRGIAGGRRFSI